MELKKIPEMYQDFILRKKAQKILDDPKVIKNTDGLLYMYQCVFYLNPQKYGNNCTKLVYHKGLLHGLDIARNKNPYDLIEDGVNVEVKFTVNNKIVSQAIVDDNGVPVADKYILIKLLMGPDVDSSELLPFFLNKTQMQDLLNRFGRPSHSNPGQNQFNVDSEEAVEFALDNYYSRTWQNILLAKG